MPLYTLDGVAPQLDNEDSTWIAPDASVIGKVRLGKETGVWFGAVLRATTN
jgi:carbonic anhydrase/acetyltransferase-like protein (isoleucine patch superfamily)